MKYKLFLIGFSFLILFLHSCVEFEYPVQDDKVQWEAMDTTKLPSNTILAIEEYDNRIWCATLSGIHSFTSSYNPINEEFMAYDVFATENALLIASPSGNVEVEDNNWNALDLGEVTYCITAYGDFVWSATSNSVKYSILSYPIRTVLENVFVNDLYTDRDKVVVSTYGDGLYIFDATSGKLENNYRIREGLPNDTCLTAFRDSQDRLWIGINSPNEGLCQIEGKTLIVHNFGFINSILEDDGHNLWLGSLGYGVYKWETNGNITNYTMLDGLPCNYVNDILISDDGTIWAATMTGGIAKLKPQSN